MKPASRQESLFTSRPESFGTVVQTQSPRALLFLGDSPLKQSAPLSAPLEAHLQLTNRCDAGCTSCYTNSTSRPRTSEWGLAQWKRAIDELAEMRVFHLALGGGESADLPWLGEIAAYARMRGLVPNLTTSGLSNLGRVLAASHLFGQVNISIDGLGDTYARVRGFDGFSRAQHAARELRKRTKYVGINVVVTRHNFSQLPQIVRFAEKNRLNEVELLRLKPSGRGHLEYEKSKLTPSQQSEFYPLLRKLARRSFVRFGRTPRVRIDCSMFPFLTEHGPSIERLHFLGMSGCTAGDFLIGAKANGAVSGCSFLPAAEGRPKLTALKKYWTQPDAFASVRDWRALPQPCASCEYVNLCRGGCRAVSVYYTGSMNAPDPECHRVRGSKFAPKGRARLPVLLS